MENFRTVDWVLIGLILVLMIAPPLVGAIVYSRQERERLREFRERLRKRTPTFTSNHAPRSYGPLRHPRSWGKTEVSMAADEPLSPLATPMVTAPQTADSPRATRPCWLCFGKGGWQDMQNWEECGICQGSGEISDG